MKKLIVVLLALAACEASTQPSDTEVIKRVMDAAVVANAAHEAFEQARSHIKAQALRLDESEKKRKEFGAALIAANEQLTKLSEELEQQGYRLDSGLAILRGALRGMSDTNPAKATVAIAVEALSKNGVTVPRELVVETPVTNSTAHVHIFKPSGLIPGEHVCSCGQYYVV